MRRLLFMAELAVPLALATPAGAQYDSLTARLREQRLAMAPTAAGGISGAGAELLAAAAADAQFTLLGEEHGVAEVPQVARALLERLVPAGYRHVAIETSAALASALQEQFRSRADYAAWLRQHHPVVAFYNWNREAEFARAAVALLPDVPDVLWGLDYDIMGDRYALRKLRSLAADEVGRSAVDRVIRQGDSALSVALEMKQPGAAMMWGGPGQVWQELAQAVRPAPGSEAENILHVLAETRAINGAFLSGRNYESNLRRAQLNKAQFMRYYRAAERREGKPPRVLFKFGASHAYRGLSQTNVFDLGTMASELAESLGGRSFHMLLVAGPGAQVAGLDPTVFRTVPRPATALAAPWMKPFLDAADSGAWNVFDLRPLRPLNQARQLGVLPDALQRLLYAFDAVVVLGGSTPQQDLLDGGAGAEPAEPPLRQPVRERLVLYVEASAAEIEAQKDSVPEADFAVIADDLMFYRAAALEYLERQGVPFVRLTGRRPIQFVVGGRPRLYDFREVQLLDFLVSYEPGREPRVIAPNEVELAR